MATTSEDFVDPDEAMSEEDLEAAIKAMEEVKVEEERRVRKLIVELERNI